MHFSQIWIICSSFWFIVELSGWKGEVSEKNKMRNMRFNLKLWTLSMHICLRMWGGSGICLNLETWSRRMCHRRVPKRGHCHHRRRTTLSPKLPPDVERNFATWSTFCNGWRSLYSNSGRLVFDSPFCMYQAHCSPLKTGECSTVLACWEEIF